MLAKTHLRHLDIDDLIILSALYRGEKLKDISAGLRLTPPALSHRLKKYRNHLPNFYLETARAGISRIYPLREDTKQICMRAKQALDILGHTTDENVA
jgi:DNA-binding transcriptional ArsR family regulator